MGAHQHKHSGDVHHVHLPRVVQVTADMVESGKLALNHASLPEMAAFMQESAQALLFTTPREPDEFQWLAECHVAAPYFAGGLFTHHVRFCAENADISNASPRDRMFVIIARGQPSGRLVEETIALPGDYGWWAAIRWVRILHKKKAQALLDVVVPRVMDKPSAKYAEHYEREVQLAECAQADLWQRYRPGSAEINLSRLWRTFPQDESQLIYQMEAWSMFRLHDWEGRRDRVK